MAGSLWPRWKRGNESNLSKTEISNGNILVTIDTGRMFIDIDNKRIEISDFIKKTESEILAILAPLPKLYLATDTRKIYYHDGENWASIEAGLADKIKATLSNTTKGYLLGVSGSGETPVYDSEVYLDVIAGDLHAKTFNGFTLASASEKEVSDSTSAEAIGSGNSLVTERDVYYGLPNVNGVHTYTSNTSIFAPTVVGTSGQILKSNGSGAPTWVNQSSLDVGSATKATQDGNGNNIVDTYAPLNSPEFTGSPNAPTATAGTNTTQIATTAFVATAVANALTGITSFEFSVVETLPTTGSKGIIYLVSNNGSNNNIYDEFIWVANKYEKIGTTDIDLSNYVTINGAEALTNKTYNGYTLGSACSKTVGASIGNVPVIGAALGTTDNVPVVTDTSGQLKPHASGALGSAAFKGVSDSTSAGAIGTGSNLVTERDIYHGLPTINNSHDYTSGSSFYTPTTGGTSGYILKANGETSAPSWISPSALLASLGCGYGTCSTNTADAVVTLANYSLIAGGIIAVKFDNEVPENATLNVNNKGAKAIYHNGLPLAEGVIEANSIAMFVYDGTHYALISTDFNAGNDFGNHLELEGYYNGFHLELD